MTVAAADVLRGRRPAGHRRAVRLRLDRGVRPRVPSGARRQPRRRAPRRRPPSHTTAAQVPPDRRREHHHGHPHRRTTRLPARRARRPRAAHPRGHQPAHPGAHRLPAGEEHARLKELSNTEPAGLLQVSADVDPDYTRGQRADLPARRRRHRRRPRARRPRRDRGSGRHVGGVPHRGRLPASPAGGLGRDRDGVVPLQPVAAAPGPSIVACSTAPTTSAPPPASCGCLSNAPDRAARRR